MGVLVTLAALAVLSACSPAEKPVIALRVVDGQPTVVLAECAVFSAKRIAVFTTKLTPTAKWAIERDGGEEPGTVTLLQPPPGWRVLEQSLVAFEPDIEYSVAAHGDRNDAETVRFTLAEVTRLGPEQVLVGSGDERKAITETAFRERAKKVC
ncbi:hypothetical protein [Micromonospora vulcania]|uniref:Uncharacterized protein n=1 Tax=Micromonospora vulcania TaxID=1441873 RepID=A0ABW1H663_9ACTN